MVAKVLLRDRSAWLPRQPLRTGRSRPWAVLQLTTYLLACGLVLAACDDAYIFEFKNDTGGDVFVRLRDGGLDATSIAPGAVSRYTYDDSEVVDVYEVTKPGASRMCVVVDTRKLRVNKTETFLLSSAGPCPD